MIRLKAYFILILILTSCNSNDETPDNELLEFDYEDSIQVDGFDRRFLVHLPPSYNDQEEFPLVLTLHGGRGTPETFRMLSNMDAAADAAGYIAVYPEGFEEFWADGRGDTPADMAGIDDVEFLSQLITKLTDDLEVDSEAIFATGISNGGGMSQRLACEIPNKIRGIGIVAHSMLENTRNNCSLTEPIAAMFILGTADPLNPYEGGTNEAGDIVIGAESAVNFRVEENNCTTETMETLPNTSTTDETTTTVRSFSDCTNNAEVKLYTVENGGHTWPRLQGGQYLPIGIIGRVSNDFEASIELLNFFDSIR